MNFSRCLIGLAISTLTRGAVAITDGSSNFQQNCAAFAGSLQLELAEVLFSKFVEAGTTLEFPNVDTTCGRPSQRVSANMCRIALRVPTSNRSGFNLTSWSSHFYPLTGRLGAPTFVTFSIWPVIHDDVMQQCNAVDELRYGVLESPNLCN